MYTYLAINIGIIIIPFFLSFERRINFIRNIKAVLVSIFFVGILFILWDILATRRGDWMFNPQYLSGIYIGVLPIEEVLFFITVPYACIFTYEVIKYFIEDKAIELNFYWLLLTAPILLLPFFYEKEYTLTVTAIYLLILALIYKLKFFHTKSFFIFILISYVQFTLVNYILTSLPIVEYSNSAIIGFRILTIPIEDFIYSFTLLSLYLSVYTLSKS